MWFKSNQMKANSSKCDLLLSSKHMQYWAIAFNLESLVTSQSLSLDLELTFLKLDEHDTLARINLKAHSGLRKLFATESPLKKMKNAFYFKAFFILKIFKFLS